MGETLRDRTEGDLDALSLPTAAVTGSDAVGSENTLKLSAATAYESNCLITVTLL